MRCQDVWSSTMKKTTKNISPADRKSHTNRYW